VCVCVQLKLQSDSRPTRRGTDAKVSRNFTFRAQENSSTPNAAKRKQRKRRADPEDEVEEDNSECLLAGPIQMPALMCMCDTQAQQPAT